MSLSNACPMPLRHAPRPWWLPRGLASPTPVVGRVAPGTRAPPPEIRSGCGSWSIRVRADPEGHAVVGDARRTGRHAGVADRNRPPRAEHNLFSMPYRGTAAQIRVA